MKNYIINLSIKRNDLMSICLALDVYYKQVLLTGQGERLFKLRNILLEKIDVLDRLHEKK